MEAVATTTQPDRKSSNTSQPSSRDGTPSEEQLRSLPNDNSKARGPTIRQIRESTMANPRPPAPSPANKFFAPSSKKKSSIFGGLFATKEPTQLALNQVAAQMMAQHGSTSPTRVPNVSMEKMPDFVPKVNSKWDGVPEAVKEREKRERERQSAAKRQSLTASTFRSRSVEPSERRRRNLSSSNYNSSGVSINGRAKSSHSHRSDPRAPNPHRFYAQSVNSSGDLASQQRSEAGPDASIRYSQSSGSPSRTTHPPESIPALPAMLVIDRSGMSSTSKQPSLNEISRSYKPSHSSAEMAPSHSSAEMAPSLEALPEHTSSPVATPREGSPVTPSTQLANEQFSSMPGSVLSNSNRDSVSLESSGPNVLALPIESKRKLKRQSSGAFLAGEAQPLELPDDDDPAPPDKDLLLRNWSGLQRYKAPAIPSRSIDRVAQDLTKRPDSSRSRLGLKASMRVRTDATPWEAPNTSALSPLSANARSNNDRASNKRILPSFGSLRKKDS